VWNTDLNVGAEFYLHGHQFSVNSMEDDLSAITSPAAYSGAHTVDRDLSCTCRFWKCLHVDFLAGGLGKDQAGGADFSPAGRWIAYRSNTTSRSHIELQRRQAASAELGTLAVIDISDVGGSPRFTNERVLPIQGFQVFYGNRDYDITKDGKRLIVIVPESKTETTRAPARPQINVVLNWFEELKARVPSP
jgi:hypothetical protein